MESRVLVVEGLSIADLLNGMSGTSEIFHLSFQKLQYPEPWLREHMMLEFPIDWMLKSREMEDKLIEEFAHPCGGLPGGCLLPEKFNFMETIRDGKYKFILGVTLDQDGELAWVRIGFAGCMDSTRPQGRMGYVAQ